MESINWGLIGTLIGTLIGASVSIITTYLNNKNSFSIQKSNERFKREELFREFQRSNLLKLQDLILHSMRLVGKTHFADLMNYRKTNKWQSNLLDSDLDTDINESLRRLAIKIERIQNDQLRNEMKDIRSQMNECLLSKTYEIRKCELIVLTNSVDIVMPKLGEVLRANY